MNPKSQGVAASFRHSRESGNPGLPRPQRSLWTPAFAGVTITFWKDGIHFGSGSNDPYRSEGTDDEDGKPALQWNARTAITLPALRGRKGRKALTPTVGCAV